MNKYSLKNILYFALINFIISFLLLLFFKKINSIGFNDFYCGYGENTFNCNIFLKLFYSEMGNLLLLITLFFTYIFYIFGNLKFFYSLIFLSFNYPIFKNIIFQILIYISECEEDCYIENSLSFLLGIMFSCFFILILNKSIIKIFSEKKNNLYFYVSFGLYLGFITFFFYFAKISSYNIYGLNSNNFIEIFYGLIFSTFSSLFLYFGFMNFYIKKS